MRITETLALLAAFAGVLLASRPAPAASPPAGFDAIVERAAATFLQNGQTIGLSIGVLQNGKTRTYHFGTRERGKALLPGDRTRYAIGSITKTFTGTLLAQAVGEGRVRLDDDIRKYLDGAYPNLEYQGQPIRLWQLINHTSGLPRSLPADFDDRFATDTDLARRSAHEAAFLTSYTREDLLRDLHTVTLKQTPGTKFGYSNAAAQLLGLILERVYGCSYEELLRRKIATPLGMRDTKATLTTSEKSRASQGATDTTATLLPALPTRFPAAGSLWSTTSDMLKYVAWHLAEKDAAVKLTHQPAGDTVWSADGNFTVGLNWQILRAPGQRALFQDGNVPGFHSMVVLCPELNLGIVVLTNEEARTTPTHLSPLINQILQGIDPRMTATP